jgi:hypothetical protein
VCGKVLMSLLVSGVFGNEVQVFSTDDQGSVHLGRDDGAGEDTASDRDHTGERAFLVCIRTQGQHRLISHSAACHCPSCHRLLSHNPLLRPEYALDRAWWD